MEPELTTLNKKQCALIRIEIGFCKDFGCDNKIVENTPPLSRP